MRSVLTSQYTLLTNHPHFRKPAPASAKPEISAAKPEIAAAKPSLPTKPSSTPQKPGLPGGKPALPGGKPAVAPAKPSPSGAKPPLPAKRVDGPMTVEDEIAEEARLIEERLSSAPGAELNEIFKEANLEDTQKRLEGLTFSFSFTS